MILSRIADPESRRNTEAGEDGWSKGCIFYDEEHARREFAWLISHNNLREYILIARIPKKDDLDDDIPF